MEGMKLEIRGEPPPPPGQPALGGGAGPVHAAGGRCKALLGDLHANPHSEGLIVVAE